MYNRRDIFKLSAAAAAVSLHIPAASAADDWRNQYSELRFAVRPNENAEGMTRWSALVEYLGTALRTKVTLRQATDYAGVIEAIKSKRLELAYLGGSGYAQAWLVTEGNVEPVAAVVSADGDTGYHSMVVVKADSPYRTIDDLKGKALAYGDPNSTSGFQVPSFFLRKEGKDPKTFFARTGFTGTHENAVMAVYNGTYDGAATWFTTEDRTAVTRMESKGLIPANSMRLVWKSPKIEGDAFTVRKDLPQSLKDDVRKVLLDIPKANPELLKLLGDGTFKGVVPVNHEAYVPLVTMVKENQAERKQ
jgi:phosphonate transport system substrate-binding protein